MSHQPIKTAKRSRPDKDIFWTVEATILPSGVTCEAEVKDRATEPDVVASLRLLKQAFVNAVSAASELAPVARRTTSWKITCNAKEAPFFEKVRIESEAALDRFNKYAIDDTLQWDAKRVTEFNGRSKRLIELDTVGEAVPEAQRVLNKELERRLATDAIEALRMPKVAGLKSDLELIASDFRAAESEMVAEPYLPLEERRGAGRPSKADEIPTLAPEAAVERFALLSASSSRCVATVKAAGDASFHFVESSIHQLAGYLLGTFSPEIEAKALNDLSEACDKAGKQPLCPECGEPSYIQFEGTVRFSHKKDRGATGHRFGVKVPANIVFQDTK